MASYVYYPLEVRILEQNKNIPYNRSIAVSITKKNLFLYSLEEKNEIYPCRYCFIGDASFRVSDKRCMKSVSFESTSLIAMSCAGSVQRGVR